METTRCLRQEHQLILKVLDCFEIALADARQTPRVSSAAFTPFIEFFRGFADQCHHCKEEDRLFPQLERKGIPREGGPIGCMIREHQLGRAHVKAMDQAIGAADQGDQEAVRTVLDEGAAYLDLLRNHIAKEDNVLFEMADQLIQGEDLATLTAAYGEAESTPEYTGTLSRCRTIADELLKAYGVSSP